LTPALLTLLALPFPALAQLYSPTLPPVKVHAEGGKVKIKGIVVDRSGEIVRVREGDEAIHHVVIGESTEIYTPAAFLKHDRIDRGVETLLPGLMLTVNGRGGPNGTVLAKSVTFSSTSMRTAQQIKVGQEVLKSEVAANSDSIEVAKRRARDSLSRVGERVATVDRRVSRLDEYDEKLSTTINFETGRAELSADGKRLLDEIVAKSADLKGYTIEVTGYADTTGSEPANRDLSVERAEAVVAYLTEVHRVPLRRILNPTGFGTAKAVASNATRDGRAMNRRAEIRVLVNRGLANGSPR
jgi:outer membrane protein OmpA-like peptidoglycan-associated protein